MRTVCLESVKRMWFVPEEKLDELNQLMENLRDSHLLIDIILLFFNTW